MRNRHCRNWILVKNLKNVENETQTLYDLVYGKKKTLKNIKNKKCTMWELEYGNKTDKEEK